MNHGICESHNGLNIQCFSLSGNQLFIASDEGKITQVAFCPFCGHRASVPCDKCLKLAENVITEGLIKGCLTSC